MNKKIILTFLTTFIFLLTSFKNNITIEIYGTYKLIESTNDNLKILHKIQFQKDNLCYWITITNRNGKKEKCKKRGYFKISGNKITITWSKNDCEDCGTYANWYSKDCPDVTLEYKDDNIWTNDTIPKPLIKNK